MEEQKITFCTVSMNRTYHLKQTLPQNLQDNANYKNLEFLVLDYNSTDDLEFFIKEHLAEYLESGRLVYYKTFEPEYFHRSHSRNIAFRLAFGDIICNIDADNFTGKNFAAYINEVFRENNQRMLTTLGKDGPISSSDVLGRICVRKEDFLNARGYDEIMHSYGYEDHDLIYRLEMRGTQNYLIESLEHLQAIKHENSERIAEEYTARMLDKFLISYIDPSHSHILMLFNNGTYSRGSLQDNATVNTTDPQYTISPVYPQYRLSIVEGDWQQGEWEYDGTSIVLVSEEILYLGEDVFTSKTTANVYYVIDHPSIITEGLIVYSQLANRVKMENNQLTPDRIVNVEGFGKAKVFRNFINDTPIIL